jgi:hypothetical protein
MRSKNDQSEIPAILSMTMVEKSSPIDQLVIVVGDQQAYLR